MSRYTNPLLVLVDPPSAAQLSRDLDNSYLTWTYSAEDETAALVTGEGRVALVYYPAAPGEPYGDFEMADWYAERVTG